VAAALVGALLPLVFLYRDQVYLLLAFTVLVLLSFCIFLFRIREIRQSAGETAMFLMGFFYVPLLLGHLLLLRGLPMGVQWIFLLILIVMGGDTGAYYVGCNFGRRKLYPAVSPNKSVEGALGGLAGSIIGAFVAKAGFFHSLTVGDCLATALLLGSLGQLGDLFESLLKRSFGVKDSGALLPGHGGFWDRIQRLAGRK
jgi:phosphatidate cytidylyltransferase